MFRKEKKKGVEDLIEIENPNRVVKKNIKAKDADVNAKVELTRRERYSICVYHICAIVIWCITILWNTFKNWLLQFML